MNSLRLQLGPTQLDSDELPMTAEQLTLTPSRFISLGGHGMTHQPLTSMDKARRLEEIRESKKRCEEVGGVTVQGFAYPHGDLDADTLALVRSAGYQWACSTHAAAIDTKAHDLFNLPRIMATDIPGPDLIAQLGREL